MIILRSMKLNISTLQNLFICLKAAKLLQQIVQNHGFNKFGVNQPCDLALKYSNHVSHFTLSLANPRNVCWGGLEKEIERRARERGIRKEKKKKEYYEQTTLHL